MQHTTFHTFVREYQLDPRDICECGGLKGECPCDDLPTYQQVAQSPSQYRYRSRK